MSYLDEGYSKLLIKNEGQGYINESPEDLSSAQTPLLSGGVIAGGVTRSSDGLIEIDWDNGSIIISDGAHRRVLIGNDGL